MNKNRAALIIAIIIGAICIIFGLAPILAEKAAVDFYLLFIGITIAGTAYFQLRKTGAKGDE